MHFISIGLGPVRLVNILVSISYTSIFYFIIFIGALKTEKIQFLYS